MAYNNTTKTKSGVLMDGRLMLSNSIPMTNTDKSSVHSTADQRYQDSSPLSSNASEIGRQQDKLARYHDDASNATFTGDSADHQLSWSMPTVSTTATVNGQRHHQHHGRWPSGLEDDSEFEEDEAADDRVRVVAGMQIAATGTSFHDDDDDM